MIIIIKKFAVKLLLSC